MWIIILAIIIFFVVRHYRKKKAASDGTPTSTSTSEQSTAPNTTSATSAPSAHPTAKKATLDKPLDSPTAAHAAKVTLDKPNTSPKQSAPETQPEAEISYQTAPASAIEGLDYMKVRQYTDNAKRIPLMMAFADAGDELAQYEVGQLYVMGLHGMKKDLKKGKELLYKAGRGGATNAIALLGQVCIRQALDAITVGEKLGRSHEECMVDFTAFYDEGADALAWGISTGNEMSMDTVSGAFQLGWNQGELGQTLVFATTRALAPRLEKLREKDDGHSNFVLGTIALRGICMDQDLEMARHHYQRGAEQGDHNCVQALKNPLLSIDDDEDDDE